MWWLITQLFPSEVDFFIIWAKSRNGKFMSPFLPLFPQPPTPPYSPKIHVADTAIFFSTGLSLRVWIVGIFWLQGIGNLKKKRIYFKDTQFWSQRVVPEIRQVRDWILALWPPVQPLVTYLCSHSLDWPIFFVLHSLILLISLTCFLNYHCIYY